jgi:hypothetical protein
MQTRVRAATKTRRADSDLSPNRPFLAGTNLLYTAMNTVVPFRSTSSKVAPLELFMARW